MKAKKEELVLDNGSPNVGTEHKEINTAAQTKRQSDLRQSEGPLSVVLFIYLFIFVLFVSPFFFSFFFSPHFQPWSAARVVLPTIPQLLFMFCFTTLASQVD